MIWKQNWIHWPSISTVISQDDDSFSLFLLSHLANSQLVSHPSRRSSKVFLGLGRSWKSYLFPLLCHCLAEYVLYFSCSLNHSIVINCKLFHWCFCLFWKLDLSSLSTSLWIFHFYTRHLVQCLTWHTLVTWVWWIMRLLLYLPSSAWKHVFSPFFQLNSHSLFRSSLRLIV